MESLRPSWLRSATPGYAILVKPASVWHQRSLRNRWSIFPLDKLEEHFLPVDPACPALGWPERRDGIFVLSSKVHTRVTVEVGVLAVTAPVRVGAHEDASVGATLFSTYRVSRSVVMRLINVCLPPSLKVRQGQEQPMLLLVVMRGQC